MQNLFFFFFLDDPELSGNGLRVLPLITCRLPSNKGKVVLMLKINTDTTLSSIVFLVPGVAVYNEVFFFLKGTTGQLLFLSFEIVLFY